MGTHDTRSIDEVIYDISFNFGHILHSFDRSGPLMDMLEGSRGLKDRIIAWAHEFDDAWFKRPEGEREEYLSEVDEFADKKWRALLAELDRFNPEDGTLRPADAGIITAIQVVPYMELASGRIEPQFEGPDEHTTGWGIYKRTSFGTVVHVADVTRTNGYEDAMLVGSALAAKFEVEIEPQPWVVDEHEFTVTWIINVSAGTPREAAEKAREMQLDPSSTATVFTVDTDGSQVPQTDIDLSVQ